MDVNKKIFVSDYDQTFYLNDEEMNFEKKEIFLLLQQVEAILIFKIKLMNIISIMIM